jgi:uncharacterized membrane protein
MNFKQKYSWLTPMFMFIGILIIGRLIRTSSMMFLFIPWNLFLAIVPLYLSFKLLQTTGKTLSALIFLSWLLFFPNAMYIITDLFHLQERPKIPLWYDLILLFSSAILGVIMGYLSVLNVELYLRRHIKSRSIPFVILSFFLLCGYGIYLGRYLRWNSWDIITDPFTLAADMAQDVVHPFRNKECWLLTVLFGIWLYIMYKYFKKLPLANPKRQHSIAKF